jgi:hypothetical protein
MEKEIEEPQTATEKKMVDTTSPRVTYGMYSSGLFATDHIGAAWWDRSYEVPAHIEEQYK